MINISYCSPLKDDFVSIEIYKPIFKWRKIYVDNDQSLDRWHQQRLEVWKRRSNMNREVWRSHQRQKLIPDFIENNLWCFPSTILVSYIFLLGIYIWKRLFKSIWTYLYMYMDAYKIYRIHWVPNIDWSLRLFRFTGLMLCASSGSGNLFFVMYCQKKYWGIWGYASPFCICLELFVGNVILDFICSFLSLFVAFYLSGCISLFLVSSFLITLYIYPTFCLFIIYLLE